MIILVEAHLSLYHPGVSQTYLEDLGQYAFEMGQHAAQEFFPRLPVEIYTRIEEGSVKTWVIIGATLLNLFIHYGSIRQSFDYAIKDGQAAGQFINEHILGREKPVQPAKRAERTSRVLHTLGDFVAQVERGKTPADVAIQRIREILDDAGELEGAPEIVERLADDLRTVAARGQQTGTASAAPRAPSKPPTEWPGSIPISNPGARWVTISEDRTTGRRVIRRY